MEHFQLPGPVREQPVSSKSEMRVLAFFVMKRFDELSERRKVKVLAAAMP